MIIRIFMSFIILLALFHIIRTALLLRNANKLFNSSAQFSRDYFVDNTSDPILLYVAMGNSTAVGTGAQDNEGGYVYAIATSLTTQKRYVHVVNIAVSGAKVADVASDQLSLLSKYRPNVVTLMVGANDATHFTNKASFERNINKTLSAIIDLDAHTTLIASTPNLGKAPAFPRLLSYFIGQRASQQNKYVINQIEGT